MNLSRDQRVWLELQHIALLEIRALEDVDLPRARDWANIFHNLPLALSGPSDAWESHKSAMFSRAAAAGLEEVLRRDLAYVESKTS